MHARNTSLLNNMNSSNPNPKPITNDLSIHKISPISTRKSTSICNSYLLNKQMQYLSSSTGKNLNNNKERYESSLLSIIPTSESFIATLNNKSGISINNNNNDEMGKFNSNGHINIHQPLLTINNNNSSLMYGLETTKNAILSNLNGNLSTKFSKLCQSASPVKKHSNNRPNSANFTSNLHKTMPYGKLNSNDNANTDNGSSSNNNSNSNSNSSNNIIESTPNTTLGLQIQKGKSPRMLIPEINKLSASIPKYYSPLSHSFPLNNPSNDNQTTTTTTTTTKTTIKTTTNANNSSHEQKTHEIPNNHSNSSNGISQISSETRVSTSPNQSSSSSSTKLTNVQSLTPLATNRKTNTTPIPNHEPTKCSVKRNGIIKAYAANTNQGIVRNYNEDRVAIILNIMKPASRVNEDWPKCSFFGVYDGHGGVNCADFLRDNLHKFVVKESSFPLNPKEALIKGFEAAEKHFLELAGNMPGKEFDRSGSCAIVVLIVGDTCYVANVGDSRAILSSEGGLKSFSLSRDHKPIDELEQKRIIEAGGKIYQTHAPALKVSENSLGKAQMQILVGPYRVFPGRLSVSRTFGDIEAKVPKYGGNPNVVIAVPDIKAFKLTSEHDFIILASDGIFDKLSTKEVIKCVWDSTTEKAPTIHQHCGLGVENILREAINRRTVDNITVVMICFQNFQNKLYPQNDNFQIMKDNSEESDNTQILSKSPSQLDSLKNSRLLDQSEEKQKQNYPNTMPNLDYYPNKKMEYSEIKSPNINNNPDLKKPYREKSLITNPENSSMHSTTIRKQNSVYEKAEMMGLQTSLRTSRISNTPTNSTIKLIEVNGKYNSNHLSLSSSNHFSNKNQNIQRKP